MTTTEALLIDHAVWVPAFARRKSGRWLGECCFALFTAVDREIARAGEDRARLQSVEAADRMAEMGGIGIANVLCEMGEIDVLVGEMQEMPRPFPGAEGAEGDSGLLLEQMQE